MFLDENFQIKNPHRNFTITNTDPVVIKIILYNLSILSLSEANGGKNHFLLNMRIVKTTNPHPKNAKNNPSILARSLLA